MKVPQLSKGKRKKALSKPKKKKGTLPELALGNRYIAAWGEINARIQGRDNVLLTFVVVAITIIGISLASHETEVAPYLPLAVPYVAFLLTQLWTAHEFGLGLLSVYLGDISRAAGPVPEWDWHAGEKYFGEILKRRGFMYVAHVIAVLLLCVVALSTSSKLYGRSLERERLTTLKLRLPPVVISRTLLQRSPDKPNSTPHPVQPLFEFRDTLFATGDTVVVEVTDHLPIKKQSTGWIRDWWISALFAIGTVIQTLVVFYKRNMDIKRLPRKLRTASEGESVT